MSSAPAFNLARPVLWLALVLIAIHVVRQGTDENSDTWILLAFSFIPARYGEIGPLLPGGEAARFWTPATYAFLHADTLHLTVNLIWMASFGGALARRFGAVRFLLLSLFAAIAGAALHYLFHAGEEAIMIGASGAVSGMMAATARFAFAPGGPLSGRTADPAAYLVAAEPLSAIFSRSRALGFILVWFAVNLLFGLGGGLLAGVSGPIAWEAHIGGFLAGLLLFPWLDPVRSDHSAGNLTRTLLKSADAEARQREAQMTVARIINEKGRDVVTISPGASLAEVAALLSEKRIGAVVVIEDGELLGILSERDIVRGLARHGAEVLNKLASDCMTSRVVTCRPEDTINDVMQKMTTGRFRHLPVIENGKLAGLVSIGDIVKRRIEEVEREAEQIREYIATA